MHYIWDLKFGKSCLQKYRPLNLLQNLRRKLRNRNLIIALLDLTMFSVAMKREYLTLSDYDGGRARQRQKYIYL